MRCYHRTTAEAAAAILSNGFEDAAGAHLTKHSYEGVWVSDVPLDADDGADGDTLLTLDIEDKVFSDYEWVETDPQLREAKGYREALVPATQLNKSRVTIVDE
jgi:hypothetical protein